MILDLHLRLPHLAKKLVWLNDLENHFVFQFSDDGAPETTQMTMSIRSLTMWNLGKRVQSADFQYLLHCISLREKHEVLEDLWKQPTNEMVLLEGNIITVCSKQCTVEFQPSADVFAKLGEQRNQSGCYLPISACKCTQGIILYNGGINWVLTIQYLETLQQC